MDSGSAQPRYIRDTERRTMDSVDIDILIYGRDELQDILNLNEKFKFEFELVTPTARVLVVTDALWFWFVILLWNHDDVLRFFARRSFWRTTARNAFLRLYISLSLIFIKL
jgi:hypothetical protein